MPEFNYKKVEVRMVEQHGRFIVEVLIGETWNTVAIRERRACADAIARSLAHMLRETTDERFEAMQSPGASPLNLDA